MAAPTFERIRPQEFAEWQLRQTQLYELVDGIPVVPLKMMAGATVRGDRVVVNCLLSLGSQLRNKHCRPMTSDVAVRIPSGNYRRPDLTIECGTPKSDRVIEATLPKVVIEVLSPSTISFDRFRKLEEYKTVAEIEVILMIDTEAAQVTIHRRRQRLWEAETVEGLDAVISFEGVIEAELAVRDIYEGLAFPSV